MDSQSNFQILENITISMIYRLFVFIFGYLICSTYLESYSFVYEYLNQVYVLSCKKKYVDIIVIQCSYV